MGRGLLWGLLCAGQLLPLLRNWKPFGTFGRFCSSKTSAPELLPRWCGTFRFPARLWPSCWPCFECWLSPSSSSATWCPANVTSPPSSFILTLPTQSSCWSSVSPLVSWPGEARPVSIWILTVVFSVVMVGVKTRVREHEQQTATNIMVSNIIKAKVLNFVYFWHFIRWEFVEWGWS